MLRLARPERESSLPEQRGATDSGHLASSSDWKRISCIQENAKGEPRGSQVPSVLAPGSCRSLGEALAFPNSNPRSAENEFSEKIESSTKNMAKDLATERLTTSSSRVLVRATVDMAAKHEHDMGLEYYRHQMQWRVF